MNREEIEREAEAFLRKHRAGPRTIESLSLELADLIERFAQEAVEQERSRVPGDVRD